MSSSETIVGAGSDDAAVGTVAWTNPGNITAEDNTWATASLSATQVSHYLKGLNSAPFTFISGAATINGIEVDITRNRQAGIGNIKDNIVKLVKGGSVVGNNNASATIWPSVTDVLVTYGSSSDLWGTTWTAADVNATDFGAVLSATNAVGSADVARVDGMVLRVYYTFSSADLTGTCIETLTNKLRESHVVAGGKTIIITLTGDTWVASGGTFDGQRQNIINGLDSAQAEANGWDAEVKAKIAVTDVVRTSSTVVTITLDAEAAYNITAQETITCTVPATALTGGVAMVATPTFRVLPDINRMQHIGGLRIGMDIPPRPLIGTPRSLTIPLSLVRGQWRG